MDEETLLPPLDASLMSLAEVAKYLSLSTATIRRLLKRGEIPGMLIGGMWRFRPAAIEQWLRDKETRATKRTQTEGK